MPSCFHFVVITGLPIEEEMKGEKTGLCTKDRRLGKELL
jgi:hypothetical protein